MEEALISRGRRSPPDAGDRPKRRRTVTAKAPVQTRASTRGRGRTATTRRQGPLRGSGTLRNHLSQEREPKATSPHHVVQPAVVERVWCSECEAEALPGAPCHSEHAVVGLQRMVDQVAMDLRAQQDAVCRELPRFRECLELMRFRARAAEERQDVAALRAEAAAQAACFEGLEQRLRKFVEDARRCWAEASVPETRRVDEEAVSHLRLSAVKSEPVDGGQLFGSVELHLELKQEQDEQGEVNGASTSSVDDMDRLMEAEPPLMLSAVKSEPLVEGQLFDSVTTHDEVKQEWDEQEHVDEASILSMPYTVGLRIFAPDECLDVIEETKREKYSQDLEDFLQDPGLDKVKWLDGVYCLDRPSWCVSLLKRVAPRVEWLYLFEALTEHLHVVHEMPALRYLHVHLAYKDENDPDLPVQLEELTVENVSTKHFKSVQRMPRLRKLSLDWSDDIVDVESPPLPAHHRGLQWLWVSLRPCSTVLSLAKAHAATLQELRILCASHGDTPWHFRDLAAGLRDCGLVALRRIVLLRRLRADEPDDAIPHHVKPCQQQKKNIRVQLLASGLTPKIFCEECDVAPKFPELGDFTWKNS